MSAKLSTTVIRPPLSAHFQSRMQDGSWGAETTGFEIVAVGQHRRRCKAFRLLSGVVLGLRGAIQGSVSTVAPRCLIDVFTRVD